MDGCPVTDWITAIGTAGAAVGTVGAVIVALGQIRRQERRSLNVVCAWAIVAPPGSPNVRVLSLRGTNDGFRPVKVAMA